MSEQAVEQEDLIGLGAAKLRPFWDRWGMFASSLCAVHCMCMPALLLAMPFLASTWLVDREIERGFVIASVCFAAVCTSLGVREHGKWWLLGLLGAGSAVLLGAHATAPPTCCSEHLSWPHALSAACGGFLLATTHYFNIRLQRALPAAAGVECCGHADCAGNQ